MELGIEEEVERKKEETKLWLGPGEKLEPPEFEDLRERLKAFLEGERKSQRMECFYDRGTGLLNRVFLYEFIKYLRSQGEESLRVMVFDLDFLKAYNTYFGDHSGGDRAIAEFVSAFRGAAEEVFEEGGYWLVKEYGDTFLVLLSEEVAEKAGEFRREVEARLSRCEWKGPEEGTEKFEHLTEEQKEGLMALLFPPRATSSPLAEVPIGTDKEFEKGLDKIQEELNREKKERMRKLKVDELVARLG